MMAYITWARPAIIIFENVEGLIADLETDACLHLGHRVLGIRVVDLSANK